MIYAYKMQDIASCKTLMNIRMNVAAFVAASNALVAASKLT